jgi:hypothetical protein
MRNFVVATVCVLGLASSAPAALVLRVDDVTVGSAATTVTVDVWVEEGSPTDNFSIAGYNVGLRLQPATSITVQGFGPSTDAHPSLFTNDTTIFDFTNSQPQYNPNYDRFLSDDTSPGVAVENDVREGFFSITYNIAPGTSGMFTLTVDPTITVISDNDGIATPYVIDNGSITITPVPEPSALALGLFALPLLARRRR